MGFRAAAAADFEDLRRALIESTANYAPDYSAKLILGSDASFAAPGCAISLLHFAAALNASAEPH